MSKAVFDTIIECGLLWCFARWFQKWRREDRNACPFCGAGWGSPHRDDCYMHEDPPKG